MSVGTFELVMGRLQEAIGLDSETALAAALGMKSAAYFNRKKAGSIPYEHVIQLALDHELDLQQLFKGVDVENLDADGARELTDSLVSAEAQQIRDAGAIKAQLDYLDRFADFELIERKGILGSAGYGAENVIIEPKGALAFRRDWLRSKGVTPRQLIVADIVGDSMEPTLFDGDVAVFREQREITADDVYLFDLDGRLSVKRLRWRPGASIELISDNREKYPPFELSEKEAIAQRFEVKGRFFWRGGDQLQ